jgi:hypothetical protein
MAPVCFCLCMLGFFSSSEQSLHLLKTCIILFLKLFSVGSIAGIGRGRNELREDCWDFLWDEP